MSLTIKPESAFGTQFLYLKNRGISDTFGLDLKCATTVPADEYWVIESIYGSVNTKSSAFANVIIKTRNGNGVPETRFETGMQSGGLPPIISPDLIIVKPTYDVQGYATSDQVNRTVSFGAIGPIMKIRT